MITALVLAAGLGTRIRAVSGNLPKPLIDFGGRPIIIHNLLWLAGHGVRDVWINLHHASGAIMAAIGDGRSLGLRVRYLYEPELLGTAGALSNLFALHPHAVSDPMLVVYGDNLLHFDIDRLLEEHHHDAPEATVALFDQQRHPNTNIAGGRVECDEDGHVLRFIEGGVMPGFNELTLVNAGVYAVSSSLCSRIPTRPGTDFGRDVFPAMLNRGEVLRGHVIEPEGYCLGLDTPSSYSAGLELLASRRIALRP